MDADLVRLILLLLGASLVAGIWVWDRRKRREQEQSWDDEPEPVEDADEILGLRPKTETTPTSADREAEPEDLPSIELNQAAEAEAPLVPEPGTETTLVESPAESAPPPEPVISRTPAWTRPAEPVIPAFVMDTTTPVVEEPTVAEPAAVEPELEPQPEPLAKSSPELPAVSAGLDAESELAWMPDSRAATEFTPPLREEDEPVLAPESDFLADESREPELPTFELSPEPLDQPKPKKKKPKKQDEAEPETPDPLAIRMEEDQFDLELGFSAVDDQDLAEAAANLPQLIVSINVVAKRGQPFTGEQILAAMDQVEMKAGEHDIFHRYDNRLRDKQNGKHKVLFSLASLVEPGSFPLKKMRDFSTPGLTLFAQLPGPRDGLVVYSDMLYVAERLVRLLDARLKDESRSALTKQTIEHTRSRIAEHKRQITLKLRESNQQTKGRR